MNANLMKIRSGQTIQQAFELMNANQHGAVVVVAENGTVMGVATDGDIRRWLIHNEDMRAPIELCMNREFRSATLETPRESILKMLDHRVRFVPILDREQRLQDIITREHFPLNPERTIIARAKSPVRISFGGGGTDLTHYFSENGGAVMNATISLYAHATLRKRSDDKISVTSHDMRSEFKADSFRDLSRDMGNLNLIGSLLRLINPHYGFDLELGSEFPVGSGLGGSAVVLASVIGCFNQFREDRWDNYEIAEMAFQAERLHSNMAGGWQDQYATVFGGFNFMEFSAEHNVVHPLRIHPDILRELEASLLLCYSGGTHSSGEIHKDQKEKMKADDVRQLVAAHKDLTYRMKTLLLRGQLIEFGKCLDQGWQLKRQFSDKISNGSLDKIYDLAREHGSVGGKLLGAGGGGYFLFYVKPFQRFALQEVLADAGYRCQPFVFDHGGLQTWTVREERVFEV